MKKTVVITGGANGIGRCLAQAMLQDGDKVIVVDIDETRGCAFERAHTPDLVFIHTDLSTPDGRAKAVKAIRDTGLMVDVLVHNAAIGKGGLLTADEHDFMDVLAVNLIAPFSLTKGLMDRLSSGASVINIASTRAFQSQPDGEAYAASKGGLVALTHAMAMTLAGKARVNAIAPGWIDTASCTHEAVDHKGPAHRQHPSGRIGSPADIVKAVLYLSDPDNRFINGQTIVIDGAMTRQMIYHQDHGWSYDPEPKS